MYELRLVPISMTLNEFELRNGPYFALFYRIWQWPLFCIISPYHVLEQLLGLPRFQNLFFTRREAMLRRVIKNIVIRLY